MSTFNPPADIIPLTKARSLDINSLSDAVEAAFDLLPDEQAIGAGTVTYAADVSTVPNVYVVTLTNPPTSYIDGMEVSFNPKFSSTGPSSVNVNGLGVVAIKSVDGSDIQFEIFQNIPATLRYSTTSGFFYVESSSGAAAISAAAAAAQSAAEAAASAAHLVEANDLISTSTSSVLIGSGIKSFTTQPNKFFKPNMPIRFGVTASPGVFMDGYIRTYDSTTGATTIQSEQFQGAGTYSAWTLMITGPISLGAFGGGGASTLTSGLATDYLIDATKNKFQTASVASGGAFVMDDPVNFPSGYYLFEFENRTDDTYNGDLTIKENGTGNHLAYLAPNRATAVHLDVNADFVFPDANPVGKPLRFTATAASRISGTAGAFVRVISLDSDRTLFIIHGISMHAVVYQISTNTWGALSLIRTTWAGTGSIDNVVAKLIGTDTVLVASCPENTTTLNMVVLTTSVLSVTPGAVQSSPLGAASARLLEIMTAGASHVLGYVTAAGTPRIQARTVTGTTVSAPGTEATGPVGTAPPAMIDGANNTIALVTSTASTLSGSGYSFAGTVITAGSVATTSLSTVTGLRLAKSDTGRWFVAYYNSTARVAAFTVGSVAGACSVSSPVVISPNVTALSTIQVQQPNSFYMQVATTGQNSAGEFLTEFTSVFDPGSGTPTLIGPAIARYSTVAQTVAPVGTDYSFAFGPVIGMWTISTTKNTELHSFRDDLVSSFTTYRTYRLGAMSVASGTPLQSIYPKQVLHNSALHKFGTRTFSTLGDGSKAALYSKGNDLGTMRTSPPLINDPVNGAKGTDHTSVWLAYSMGTDSLLTLEQVRMA